MPFIEKFFLLCPLFGVSFIGGSTVVITYTVSAAQNKLFIANFLFFYTLIRLEVEHCKIIIMHAVRLDIAKWTNQNAANTEA